MISLGRTNRVKGVAAVTVAAVAVLGFSSVASASPARASAAKKFVGAVYTETNGNPNKVLAFARYSDGSLKQTQAVNTGGTGGHEGQPGCTPPPGCPIIDTQGEVNLTPDGKLLFVVNAGSNTVTSFQVTSHGLKRVSVVSSGGTFPNSLDSHGNLLYVLNSNSRNIAGFRISSVGKLTPIKGSHQSLTATTAGDPRQIGFDHSGNVLIVTLLTGPGGPSSAAKSIDTFVLKNGTPGKAKVHDATSPLPFGFAVSGGNYLVVSQVHDLSGAPSGDAATYKVTGSGGANPSDTKGTNGFAPCWVVITRNNRFVYVVNTGGPAPSGATVSVFSLSSTGKLALIQVTPVVDQNGQREFAKTDEALSPDNRFLYVLVPGLMTNTSRIDIYKVGSNGKLALSGTTPSTMAGGASGLAAGPAPAPATKPKTTKPTTPTTSPSFTG